MLNAIRAKVAENSRLSDEEARFCLSDESDVHAVGALAHQARCRIHPPERVTYLVDRNINYTNVCSTGCRFCAYSVKPGNPDAWTLSVNEIIELVSETLSAGGTGILLQGGHNSDIPFSYYIDVLKAIKARFPTIHVHAFSPPEIIEFSRFYSMSAEEILGKFIRAGLDSIPGGGAEILGEPIRSRIAPRKCSGKQWLDLMRLAHSLGLKTTATMVIGFGETIEERLEHLLKLRYLQDETGGFTAFIPWTFQSANTAMEAEVKQAGGLEYLRIQAAARLILDNIPHHQVSWVTQGLRLGSAALKYGADDFSSVMMEEKVVASAKAGFRTTEKEMRAIIKAAGFIPVKRLTLYQNILHA